MRKLFSKAKPKAVTKTPVSGEAKATTKLPEPVAVIESEGGAWTPFTKGVVDYPRVHAILFNNGAIFDTTGGWRNKSEWLSESDVRKARK